MDSRANTSEIRIMLVDDSAVVRGLVSRALKQDPDLHVVASASDGVMAMQLLKNEVVDVILLDIEMPEMDGITALPKLLEIRPDVKVIMVSTLSQRGAEISMQALALGAVDYVPKPSTRNDVNTNEAFYTELRQKIKALGIRKSGESKILATPLNVMPKAQTVTMLKSEAKKVEVVNKLSHLSSSVAPHFVLPADPVRALAIGSSTGGPQAIMQIFTSLKDTIKHIPVFITQHMPPTFTTILADHIAKCSGITCMEAKQGEVAKAGCIYIAPGDFHMVPQLQGGQVVLTLNQHPPVNYCRPSVDPMLEALADIYGKNLLVAILTGMGQDGLEGCKKVVAKHGSVIAQDEASCVVYGMPKAVADNKLVLSILPLSSIPAYLHKAVEIR